MSPVVNRDLLMHNIKRLCLQWRPSRFNIASGQSQYVYLFQYQRARVHDLVIFDGFCP